MTPHQPLRVPVGWRVDWNTLYELDPTEENVRRGFFGGSSLFLATNSGRRFCIDVEWRPEDDPTGCYRLLVLYAPWPRGESGRRRKDEPLAFDWVAPLHEFTTRTRAELVAELEKWLLRCATWVREPN